MESLSGMSPPSDISLETLKEQVLLLLWLDRINECNSLESRLFAGVLGAVLEYPDNFPDACEWKEKINLFQDTFLDWTPSCILTRSKLTETLINKLMGFGSEITGNVIQQKNIFALDTKKDLRLQDQTVPEEFKTSLCLVEPNLLNKPILDNIENYVTKIKPSLEREKQAQDTSEALQSLFNLQVEDSVADRCFAELKKQITDFGNIQGSLKDQYKIKDLQSLQNLKIELKENHSLLSISLLNQAKEILELANRPFLDSEKEAQRQAKRMGGLEKPLALPELLQLFRMRDREKYHTRNPALSFDEIEVLNRQIEFFLIHSVTRQQQERLINKIEEIENGIIARMPEQELEGLVEEFVAIATTVRQFEIHEHPEYLNLEYQSEIVIRGSQAINQERIASFKPRKGSDQVNGAVVEIIPGAGKTSVHLTLQLLNDADGKRLPLAVMPESLLPQMSKELQERLGDAYEQVVEIMTFDRNDIFDSFRLERIKHRLEQIIKDRKGLLMTDSSVQSLILKFVEKVLIFANNKLPDILEIFSDIQAFKNNPLKHFNEVREITLFREIFAILRSSGIVTIDEIHLIMDVLKAHHFTLGEPQPPKEEVLTTTIDFYLLLATHPVVQEKIQFNFLADKGGSPFDSENYQKEVQPILVEAILNGAIGKNDREVSTFFKNLNERQKQWLKLYINNKVDEDASTFVDQIPSMKIKNTLAILKEEISLLLPLTGKKLLNEHYGALPSKANVRRKDRLLAISYHGSNNPVINAQFGTDLEIIHYTIQMYLGNGIPKEIIQQEIDRLKNHMRNELSKGTIKNVEASPSYLFYKKICRQSPPPPIFNLNDNDLADITSAANQQVEVQLELIKRYILPQLKSYLKQLHTNGQIYAAIFYMVRGFSGTLRNAEAFPAIFHEIFFSDTMAKTLNILWENSPHNVEAVHFPEQKTTEAIVESIYANRSGFMGSFTDAAGLFREISDNEDVARAILSYQKHPIEGIAYYNQEGKLSVLLKGQNTGVPIDQCGLNKEKMIAYWDQKHTYGADIKLGALMTSTISIGQFTMISDLIQAVWRLRQLDRGQRVDFIVAAEDEKIIRETLKRITKEEIGDQLELSHLFIYTMYNQAMRQGDDNHRSLKQKMQALLIGKIFQLVADPSVSNMDFMDCIVKAQNLFVTSSSEDPYEQYGKQMEYAKRDIVLEQEFQQFLDSKPMKAFANQQVLSKRFPIKELEKELREIVNKERSKLPDQLLSASKYETERFVQLEAELETETKQETKTETQTQRRVELYGDEGFYTEPFPDILWKKEFIFKKEFFEPSDYTKLSKTSLPYSHDTSDIVEMGVSPVVKVKDVILNENRIYEYADLIDPNLTSTLNSMPVYSRGWLSETPIFRPFGRFHDPSSYLILVEDKISGEHQFIRRSGGCQSV